MDPRIKAYLRLAITLFSTASLALSVTIVHTGGGSTATDCLSRWAVLLMMIVWLEYAFELGRQTDEIMQYDPEDDPLVQGTGKNPRAVKAPKWISDEAAQVTWKVFGLVLTCLGSGLVLGIISWNLDIPHHLTALLHSGNDTLMLIWADNDMIRLAFMFASLALSVMVLGWLLLRVARAHPAAWQQAISIGETEAAWTFRGLALIGIGCLIFAGINVESYARITSSGIAINRFPYPGETFQNWSSVKSIRKHHWTRTVSGGRSGRRSIGPYVMYSIEFHDGSTWKSAEAHESQHDPLIEKVVQPAMDYASLCSRRPIEPAGDPAEY